MEANANCEVDEAKRLLCNHLHEVMMTHVTVKEKYASWFDENDDDTSADEYCVELLLTITVLFWRQSMYFRCHILGLK